MKQYREDLQTVVCEKSAVLAATADSNMHQTS